MPINSSAELQSEVGRGRPVGDEKPALLVFDEEQVGKLIDQGAQQRSVTLRRLQASRETRVLLRQRALPWRTRRQALSSLGAGIEVAGRLRAIQMIPKEDERSPCGTMPGNP